MKGRRVADVDNPREPHPRLEPGDYRRTRHPSRPGEWVWECRPPGDLPESIQGWLGNHEITEHEDGTITVSPSILIRSTWAGERVEWHGYLERGAWRQV